MRLSTILFTLSLLALFVYSGCDDDDGSVRIPLTYDPATTIYATFGDGRETASEVVIDLETGRLDSIPGTTKFVSLSFPLGPRYFQTFNPDRRVLPGIDNQLSVQDLETFQYNNFTVEDPTNLFPLTNPQFITRGRNDNELLVLDTDQSVWRADLQNFTLTPWIDDVTPQGRIVDYFYQLDDDKLLRIFSTGFNDGMVRMIDVLDVENEEIVGFDDLDQVSFGFVKQPGSNDFYFLTAPRNGNGIRLGVLSWDGNNLSQRIISTENLPIDNISTQKQTIHSATNTFIATTTNNDIEDPQEGLIRIDLTTGELIGVTDLERGGILFKIAGQ